MPACARWVFSCAERIAQNDLRVNAARGDLTRMSQMFQLFLRGCRLGGKAGSDNWLKEGHHGPKLGAELLDGVGLRAMPRWQKVGTAFFVFLNPFFGEAAVADFGENLAHFLAGLLGDDPWARGVVSLFGSVADRIAHVAEATTIDQVDNQL